MPSSSTILVTGGAGYIGGATVQALHRDGRSVVVLDDLRRGHRQAIPSSVPFYQGSVGDARLVAKIIRTHGIQDCIHFAALAYVGESVCDPALYFENNLACGIRLLNTLRECGVQRFVFSSTCATYGVVRTAPIAEAHPQIPVSPYGWSKLALERALDSYDQAYGFRFVALRYFNAAGATPSVGEHHTPETHLIPNVLAAASGACTAVRVFGTDYPTGDGTAVRDYIHIADLASAHILALDYLGSGGASDFLNLGTGHGSSVKQVIQTAESITGVPIPVHFEPRRPGDPPFLVADPSRARRVLGWAAACSSLEYIVRSAWDWYVAHPKGYEDTAGSADSR